MTDPYTRRKLIGAILITILLQILLIGEAMRDRTLRRWAFAWLCVIVGGLSAIATCVWLLVSPVLAHDHEHPELTPWYQTLKSGKGMCCDGTDAVHLADVDWETKSGHYRVRIDVSRDAGKVDMQWIDVPDEAVVTEPNRDGRALVWPLHGYMGTSIRCFMPGSMT